MPLRKVLLLTYHFPPSGAVAVYRMLGLVRYLPKYGWQPIVVAPPRVPWEPEDASLLAQVPPETPIERVPFASGFVGKIARYLAPESHWLWKARPACNRMIREHRPEAIFTTSPPGCVHLIGMRLQKRFGLPWLADFRDPWITNLPVDRRPLRWRCARWLEGRVMRRATTLIANTPLNQRGWAEAYPREAHKMVAITNGFDPDRFTLPPMRPADEKMTILHAGELYHGRDPRPLLDALGELQTGPVHLSVNVEFLGRTTESLFDFSSEIRSRRLENIVRLESQVPYADALKRMMQADILLIVQTPEYRVGVPAKLYEYLGAGRPILALAEPDSDIGWVLRESRMLHRIAPPRDVARIKQAVVELTREVRAGCPAVLDRDALRQFTRERMAERVAECLDRSVSTRVVTP
jgi:glycosyltransferase involved in cell wall biosynthesis